VTSWLGERLDDDLPPFVNTAATNTLRPHPQSPTRFSSPKLRFGVFDVCVWPGAAAELKIGSNTWSNQLPTVVLFDKGKEWGRLPAEAVLSNPFKKNAYTKVRRPKGSAVGFRAQQWLALGARAIPSPSLLRIPSPPQGDIVRLFKLEERFARPLSDGSSSSKKGKAQ
jgi:hypothetical protein